MKKFELLDNLLPHIDKAFESFYDTMLNDVRLSIFFDSHEQIVQLIEKQKKSFTYSLKLNIEDVKTMYIKLGELHYDLRIPYVDFVKGTDILEQYFLIHCNHEKKLSVQIMEKIFKYFRIMKAFTAKGYLNRMLREDTKDIESFFENYISNNNTYLKKSIVITKLEWLKNLLYSIKTNGEFDFENNQNILGDWIHEMEFLSLEKRQFFEDLENRILINTQNLFYFLKKEEYLEILPLYTSLLSIYKLTLMMNNAVTIEYANKIIDDMRMDSLSKLFRKDLFEEILKIEMALVNREDDYIISVVYIDIDNFKHINDNYGHYSGDKVIEQMGELIRKNIRASDIGFRIGGDEFAIIFKQATKEQAKKACEKIKADFTTYNFIFNDKISFNVYLSIGIEDYSKSSNVEIESLIKNVDKKLYEAKNKGKNQICF